MKVLTIKDIAEKAGVAVSTVSRVLNDRPDVRPQTREKVLRVIEQYQYTQNNNAKNLKRRRSDAICIIVRGQNNSFLYDIADRMLQYGKEIGQPFLIHYIGEKDDEFGTARQIHAEKKIEGFIFLGANTFGREEEITAFHLPCVLATVDASSIPSPLVGSVSVDNRRAAKMAMDFLLSYGHRRIAVFGGKRDVPDSIGQRYLGMLDSFLAHGIQFDDSLYVETGFSLRGAHRDATELLSRRRDFTALFAVSDLIAIGAMKALNEAGLGIPRDVSVVGFDGIEFSKYYNPTLTTIRQPSDEIARHSISLMQSLLKGKAVQRHILLDTELLPGASVQPSGA